MRDEDDVPCKNPKCCDDVDGEHLSLGLDRDDDMGVDDVYENDTCGEDEDAENGTGGGEVVPCYENDDAIGKDEGTHHDRGYEEHDGAQGLSREMREAFAILLGPGGGEEREHETGDHEGDGDEDLKHTIGGAVDADFGLGTSEGQDEGVAFVVNEVEEDGDANRP